MNFQKIEDEITFFEFSSVELKIEQENNIELCMDKVFNELQESIVASSKLGDEKTTQLKSVIADIKESIRSSEKFRSGVSRLNSTISNSFEIPTNVISTTDFIYSTDNIKEMLKNGENNYIEELNALQEDYNVNKVILNEMKDELYDMESNQIESVINSNQKFSNLMATISKECSSLF